MTYLLAIYNASPALEESAKRLLRFTFDVARQQYANSVRIGLIEESLLAWAKFERGLHFLETATLGPRARRK